MAGYVSNKRENGATAAAAQQPGGRWRRPIARPPSKPPRPSPAPLRRRRATEGDEGQKSSERGEAPPIAGAAGDLGFNASHWTTSRPPGKPKYLCGTLLNIIELSKV